MLGISHATVSFVLNGHSEKHKISKATTDRVLEAAKTHNYIPNQTARNLKNRRSGMIGVILGNFKMDWAEATMEGMQKAFDATDYVPFVAINGFDPVRNRKELLSSLYRRDEGIIALPLPGCDEVYRSIIQSGVPLVFIGEELPGFEEVSSAVWDAEAAAEAGMRHLIASGRKRIAFQGCDYPGVGTLRRFETYCRVIREYGLEFRDAWVSRPPPTLRPAENACLALDQFFKGAGPSPDAIFSLNDGLALPALAELEARGISVPDDVAIIGMGDLPMSAHPAIGLSTVREPCAEVGEAAAGVLLDLISGKSTVPIRRAISSNDVLIRRTTAG